MKWGRLLWYGLFGVWGGVALLLAGIALWFGWLGGRSFAILNLLLVAYGVVVNVSRRFLDKGYAKMLAARRAARIHLVPGCHHRGHARRWR